MSKDKRLFLPCAFSMALSPLYPLCVKLVWWWLAEWTEGTGSETSGVGGFNFPGFVLYPVQDSYCCALWGARQRLKLTPVNQTPSLTHLFIHKHSHIFSFILMLKSIWCSFWGMVTYSSPISWWSCKDPKPDPLGTSEKTCGWGSLQPKSQMCVPMFFVKPTSKKEAQQAGKEGRGEGGTCTSSTGALGPFFFLPQPLWLQKTILCDRKAGRKDINTVALKTRWSLFPASFCPAF